MAEKKKFYPVSIDLLGREIELLGTSLEDLDKRFVKIDLSPELRGKSVELKFQVYLDSGKAHTNPVQWLIMGSYIRRMVRKGTDYVEDSFVAKCKDSNLRIKPFLITRKKVSRRVKAGLRNAAREYLKDYVKDKNFSHILLDLINMRLQKDLGLKLKKIYPLALCEIRIIKRIGEVEESDSLEKENRNLKESEDNTKEK
ncbi:MAG: hypothetical protein QXJ28_00405 [Candidatus Pacearchaeota archaeon]